MCGGPWQGPGVPGWTQIAVNWQWLGPGNTNVPAAGYYPVYHPPGTPSHAPPRVLPTDTPSSCMHHTTGPGTLRTCTYDTFKVDQGDPRGR